MVDMPGHIWNKIIKDNEFPRRAFESNENFSSVRLGVSVHLLVDRDMSEADQAASIATLEIPLRW